jgi:hypothetical protein
MKKKSSKQDPPQLDEEFASSIFALKEHFQQMAEDERDGFMAELQSAMESEMNEREVLLEIPLDESDGKASVSSDFVINGPGRGINVTYVDNGLMEIAVLPERGMGIWKLHHRGIGTDIGWQSPVREPVHPSLVNLESRNGLGWLDGFNELLCRCGLSSNGPPGNDPGARSPIESALTLHGRIANLPASEIRPFTRQTHQRKRKHPDIPDEIGVEGIVRESVLFGPQLQMTSSISSRMRSNEVVIEDVVENLGSTPTELQLLYHINLGRPLLGEGASLHVPAANVVPRDARAAEGIDEWSTCLGPTPGYAEQAYYFDPLADSAGNTVALLRSPEGAPGMAVRFRTEHLPRFVVWKCTQPESDGYVVGLEPATNYPNFKAYEREQGRVISLGPGERYSSVVTLVVLTNAAEVKAVEDEIRGIQGDREPVLHRAPQPGWSPAGEPAS